MRHSFEDEEKERNMKTRKKKDRKVKWIKVLSDVNVLCVEKEREKTTQGR